MTYKPNIHYFPFAWVILLFLQLPRYIYSQDISVSPANLPPNKIPEHIVDMDQDKNGYIWFANSTDGLVRYDGYNLKSFRPKRDISFQKSH